MNIKYKQTPIQSLIQQDWGGNSGDATQIPQKQQRRKVRDTAT